MSVTDPEVAAKRREIVSRLHAEGKNDIKIAAETGMSRKVVCSTRTALGLPALGHGRKVSDDDLISLRNKGHGYRTIAKMVGMDTSYVRRRICSIKSTPPIELPPPRTQVDRFLKAFSAATVRLPEHSTRAERAGSAGRLWMVSAASTWQSPLGAL